MEVTFENRPEDVRHLANALPALAVAEAILTMPLAVLLAAAPTIPVIFTPHYWPVGVVGLCGALWIAGWVYSNTVQEFRRASFVPGPVRMRISPDFLELEHADFRVRLSWLEIDSVSHVDRALVITHPFRNRYIVEDRHFASPQAAHEFFDAAHAFHATAIDASTIDDTFLPDWIHEEPRLSVTYQNELSHWTWAMKTAGTAHETIIKYLLVLVLFIPSNAAILYLSHLDHEDRLAISMYDAMDWIMQFFWIAIFLFFACFSTFGMLLIIREIINRWRVPARLLEPRTIEIVPQGLIARWRLGTVAFRWTALGKVTVPYQMFHIQDALQRTAFLIPMAAFSGAAEASQFSAHLRQWKRLAELACAAKEASPLSEPLEDDPNPYRSPRA